MIKKGLPINNIIWRSLQKIKVVGTGYGISMKVNAFKLSHELLDILRKSAYITRILSD